MLPDAAHQPQLFRSGFFGDEIDRPANRVGAVQSCTGSGQHFHLLHGFERQGQIQRMVSRLRVTDANAVDHDQHLIERRPSNRQIRLGAVRASLANVD